jgi:hypothetical protein
MVHCGRLGKWPTSVEGSSIGQKNKEIYFMSGKKGRCLKMQVLRCKEKYFRRGDEK